MSGGHFDYKQHHINDIIDGIAHIIRTNNIKEHAWSEPCNFPPEIISRFKVAMRWLKRAEKMVHRIDWLVSGDDSEEAFLGLWHKGDR